MHALRRLREIRRYAGAGDNLSLLRLARQAIPYLVRRDGYALPPLTIYLSVNSFCNLHCKMCDIGTANRDSSFFANLHTDGSNLPAETVKRLTDEVAPHRPTMHLNSTEPLLYKHLLEVCEHIKRRGLELRITTNGYVLSHFAKPLVELGVDQFWVSLDGPPAVHNAIRGKKDSFERAMAGIAEVVACRERLGRPRPRVNISYTITNHNDGSLVDFMECADLGLLDHVTFFFMDFVTQEMADVHNESFRHIAKATVTTITPETHPARVDVDRLVRQADEIRLRFPGTAAFEPDLTRDEMETFFKQPMRFVRDQQCRVPWFVAQFLSNGDLIPITRCYNIPLGNINRESFDEVWNGEKMRAFRKALRQHGTFPACSRCCGVL